MKRTTKELLKLYHSHKDNCCKCGCTLCDDIGTGLGSVFVLDNEGNFYCTNCDSEFEDGDERIFEAEFYENESDMSIYNVGFKNSLGQNDETQLEVEKSGNVVGEEMVELFNLILSLKDEMDVQEITYLEPVEESEYL